MIELLRNVATPVPLPAARTASAHTAFIGLAAAVFLTAGCSGTTDEPVPPAPPSLSFEEAAAGRAALTVYGAAQDLAARAWADPGQDWTGELERVTADPYRSALLAGLSAGREDAAAYSSDLTTTDPAVVDVDLAAGVINVSDCVAGVVVEAEVHRAVDGRWLVAEHTELDEPC